MTYNSQSIIFYKFWKSKKRWKWQWREKNIFRDLQVFTLVKSRSWTADPLNCRNSFGEVRWWSSNDLATCLAPPGSRRERGGAVTVSIQCIHNNDCVTRWWPPPLKVKPRKVNFPDIFKFQKSKMVIFHLSSNGFVKSMFILFKNPNLEWYKKIGCFPLFFLSLQAIFSVFEFWLHYRCWPRSPSYFSLHYVTFDLIFSGSVILPKHWDKGTLFSKTI